MIGQLTARRRFLRYLAASPLMAGAADVLAQEQRLPDPSVWGTRTLDKLIASPREARKCRRHISATWRPASTTK
jgi:hypothetical protein